ncbi:MAG: hypothetical protein ACF8R7_16200 [Phycisphaerales bacterium JB039]
MNRSAPLCVLAGALLAAPATGQLAPPPPDPVEKPPVIYPPPPPPPRPATPPPRQRGQPAPPDFEFESLVVRADDGRLKPLPKSPEYLALTRNPKLRADQKQALIEGVAAWQESIDTLVIENIDLVIDVAGGLFDRIDLNKPEDFNQAQEIMKVLMAGGRLADYLEKEDIINVEQQNATMAIWREWVNEYNKDALEAARAKHGENMQEVAVTAGRATFHLLTMNPMMSFKRMTLEIAGNFDQVMSQSGVAEAAPDEVAAAKKALAEATTDDQRSKVIVDLLGELRFSQQRAVLEANEELAPDPSFPELQNIGAG